MSLILRSAEKMKIQDEEKCISHIEDLWVN